MSAALTRVLVLADTDSYVKWAAALADMFPADWQVELILARTTAMPSQIQLDDALSGTSWEGTPLRTVGLVELGQLLRTGGPDVLVLAARGWTVQAAVSVVQNVPTRPVLVTGLPGVGVPVLPYGLGFRRAADVFVVHSRRELREFRHASQQLSLPDNFELAHLPYLPPAPTGATPDHGGPVVFAAQALVPGSRSERELVVHKLVAAARAQPERDVVIKVRARTGETQTHHEQVPYESLIAELADRPSNLLIGAGPMHRYLVGASGFVTVSSTALLEAVAADVPAVAIDDFGVGVAQINLVLRGSALLGSLEELVAGRFHRADPQWCEDNYFHPAEEDTWLERVRALVEQRAQTGLPAYRQMPGSWRNGFRRLLYRHFAFTNGAQRTGVLAFAERRVVMAALWLNQRRSRLLRSLWPSVRGAEAMEFARRNAQSAPGSKQSSGS